MHILIIDRNKSPLQISGKVAGGVCEDSKLFRAPIYWAHRAVVFAIARLSCYYYYYYYYCVHYTFVCLYVYVYV